jgi:hypothetical protein
MLPKNIPGLLANAMEFRDQYVPSAAEKKIIQKMFQYSEMEDFKPQVNKAGQDKYNRKMLLVLVSYMMRIPESNDTVLAHAKESILKLSPALVEMLLDTASEIQKAIQQGQIPPQKLSLQSLMYIIDFSQNLAQGLWDKDSSYLQLPGMDFDKFKAIASKVKEISFEKYVRMTPSERKSLSLFNDQKQQDEVDKALKVFPLIDIVPKAYTAKAADFNDPVIVGGDLMTIQVDLSLPLLQKGQRRGYMHSNEFPFVRRDNFVIMITNSDGSKILNYERIFMSEKTHTWKMQFRTGEPMKMHLIINIRNDAYKGLDYKYDLFVDVVAPTSEEDVKEFKYSKKDLKEIAKKTILGQEVIMAPDHHDSDDELEDEFKGQEIKDGESEEED